MPRARPYLRRNRTARGRPERSLPALCPCGTKINEIDIKWRYFSFVKNDPEHTLMAALACRCGNARRNSAQQWEAPMTKKSFRGLSW